jgi:excisionase family DNA binding protein
MSIPTDRILTMKEAAARLSLPIGTVARLVRETTIWGTRMDDGGWGIKESELRRFLSGRLEEKQRSKEK